MGFWDNFKDDISMGLGLKEKDDAYRERTAQNLESQGNQRGADQVRAQMTNNSGGGNTNTNTNVSNFAQSVLNSDDVSAFLPGGDKTGDDLKKFQTVYNFQSDQSDSDPGGQSTQSGVLTSRNYAVNIDPVTAELSAPQNPAGIQSLVGGSMLGRAISALGGSNQSEDKVVNIVDGKPIYQRADGTYYSINALGLPYDVAGKDTLKEDPAQVANREAMLFRTGLEENQPEEEMVAPVVDMEDPCPEGYIFDSEQKMCVIDPDIAPVTPDPIATNPYTPPPLSEYTQVTNNFIPTPLTPTAPNPIEQQLRQMQQQISGPRGQQRQPRSGLAGTTLNTGIMQARP
jgi:hypothetical protein